MDMFDTLLLPKLYHKNENSETIIHNTIRRSAGRDYEDETRKRKARRWDATC